MKIKERTDNARGTTPKAASIHTCTHQTHTHEPTLPTYAYTYTQRHTKEGAQTTSSTQKFIKIA